MKRTGSSNPNNFLNPQLLGLLSGSLVSDVSPGRLRAGKREDAILERSKLFGK